MKRLNYLPLDNNGSGLVLTSLAAFGKTASEEW